MKRHLLMMMNEAFVSFLRLHMEPAGKAALHLYVARAERLIDTLPEGEEPPVAGLDEQSLCLGLDWLLNSLRAGHKDDWTTIACESLRFIMLRNAGAITALASPPRLPAETKA